MNITAKKEHAIKGFYNGLNCAQSVIYAYSEDLTINESDALQIAAGFGGGMGKMQDTCGAVTGAFMVLGLLNGKTISDNKQLKDHTNRNIQDFSEKFQQMHQTLYCRSLLKCDLTSDKGREYYNQHNLKSNICSQCIADAIDIVAEINP